MGTAGRSRPLSRPTCTAPHQEAAWQALTDFSESDMGVKHPSDGDDLGAGLGAIHPFFLDSPADAQACHLHHQQYRDCELPAAQGSPMNRGHFPFR